MTGNHDAKRTWRVHHNDFKHILGQQPMIELVAQIDKFPFAHEACVFIAEKNELFITSNQFEDETGERKVQISKVSLGDGTQPASLENIYCPLIHMANGGVNYQGGILFCAQGSATRPSGLFKMEASAPYRTEPVLTSYMGKPFNSVNDVVIHGDGSIWFTDPSCGHDQGYRPRPCLPDAVYRYDPSTGSVRAVADGFGRPNGICFSSDGETVYITDTDQVRDRSVDYSRAASM